MNDTEISSVSMTNKDSTCCQTCQPLLLFQTEKFGCESSFLVCSRSIFLSRFSMARKLVLSRNDTYLRKQIDVRCSPHKREPYKREFRLIGRNCRKLILIEENHVHGILSKREKEPFPKLSQLCGEHYTLQNKAAYFLTASRTTSLGGPRML